MSINPIAHPARALFYFAAGQSGDLGAAKKSSDRHSSKTTNPLGREWWIS
jgi:hypothetical protein